MTLSDIIAKAREYRPCSADRSEYIRWLNVIEGRVQLEVMNIDERDASFRKYTESDGDMELLIKSPYDDVYIYYLSAMADYYNGEYDKYESDSLMFADLFEKYCKHFTRNSNMKNAVKVTGWYQC